MPEMNGLELLKRLRQSPEIRLAGGGHGHHRNRAGPDGGGAGAGANEYVMKPFTKDILVGKLDAG